MNEDALPEDPANVKSPEEHQIRQDEQGSGEGREEGDAAPFHGRGETPLLVEENIRVVETTTTTDLCHTNGREHEGNISGVGMNALCTQIRIHVSPL